ncbi:MAG TPA: enoyl-CoA hydratase/isomerase family protein [Actinomycetota bacterium]|nr:enoyl-CoA hydratase/isomerase family protein [Actinomycetota bacterium]
MSDAGTVTLSSSGDVATITIDRAEKRNALDSTTASALRAAIEEASGARVTIVTGAGRAFCAGGDLAELERWSFLDDDEIGSVLYASFQGMIRAIRNSDSVVIAAINGAAVGAGLDLALACDLRVAAAGAKLGQVWVGLGVIPGTGGAWLTQALAGPTVAAEMLLTGGLITAEQALEANLVNAVVEPDELPAAVDALAQRILRNPRDGVIANKRAIVAATRDGLEAALDHAREVQPGRFTSDEFRAAVRARLRRSGG